MQIALGAVLVFAVLWFVALRPKEEAIEPVAATPATPAQTPKADAGGAQAETALGKTVESAKNAGASADAAVKARDNMTGEEADTSTAAQPSAPAAQAPAATQQTGAAVVKSGSPVAGKKAANKAKVSAAQKDADDVIRAIKRDLKARRAVVVLVYSPKGKEDKVLKDRIKNDIARRRGKVKTYYINVSDVGRYDGLLAGLSLGQTPSTIVIAPSNEAKVLGGITSTERIDRLTSSALQLKAAAAK